MFIMAVSYGRVLLPVFLYVAGGSIYVNVADVVVVHGGGLASHILLPVASLVLRRQSLRVGIGVDDALVMV